MKKRLTTLAVLVIVIALAVTGFAGCQPAADQSTVVEPAADTADDTAADDMADDTADDMADDTADDMADDMADDTVYKIGISQIVTHPSLDVCRMGALEKLAELGYVEGENLIVDYQDAQGDPGVANTIAQQFVADNMDVILAIATPNAQAAYAVAMDKIPVVFSAVTAPAEAGLANEDGTRKAGITGASDRLSITATFDLIKALTPDAVKIGILHNTGEVNSDVQLAEAQALAADYGFEIVDAGITSTNEIASALDTLLAEVDVMMNLTDNMVVSAMPLVVQKCNEKMVPLYGSEDTQVSAGALASAGVDYHELGLITGEMIAQIFEGTPAEDIEIETIKQPILTVNSDQLAMLGITVPADLAGSVTLVETAAE